jgi:hypothetical protein
MPHLIAAEPLIDTFAESDPRMPLLVFALLAVYLEDGPFEFDASALAKRLSKVGPTSHLNPEIIASLQPEIERFFEPTDHGLVPRMGVLRHDYSAAQDTPQPTGIPGERHHS